MRIVGVNVIDVEGSKVLENRTVKIRGGKIESIVKSSDIDLKDDGYSCVDARGLYMSPGLIDCERCTTAHTETTRDERIHLGSVQPLISGIGHVHILYLSIVGAIDPSGSS